MSRLVSGHGGKEQASYLGCMQGMSSEHNELDRNRTGTPDYGNNSSSAVTAGCAKQNVRMACVRVKMQECKQRAVCTGDAFSWSIRRAIGQDRMYVQMYNAVMYSEYITVMLAPHKRYLSK